jgi:8-oxo-dGTP pyrophosphatase MutT (NUDIX family)
MTRDELGKVLARLPSVPGIFGRDEYPNSVVMLLLTEINNEYHFVFQKRNEYIRQGGEVCFPGGIFDSRLDRDRKSTALRETCEELGTEERDVEIVGTLDTLVAPMGAVIDVFVGILKRDVNTLEYNKDEVEKIFTIPVTFFQSNSPEIYHILTRFYSSLFDEVTGSEEVYLPVKELGLPERYMDPWGDFKIKVYVYKTSEEVIWGLTAGIIAEFAKFLKDDSDK